MMGTDHLLAEARSELMKHENKVESLNTCISELQQQAYAQRLEMEDAHHGYEESRREQVRLQEELVMKEKALRDGQIRTVNELGELKRALDMRVDEFSVQNLRESHDTIHFPDRRVAREVNCMSYSGEFQDIELLWKSSRVPSQPAVVPTLRSIWSRDRRMPLDTWNLSDTQGKVLWQSTSYVRFVTDTFRGILHSATPSATGAIPVQVSTGRPVPER